MENIKICNVMVYDERINLTYVKCTFGDKNGKSAKERAWEYIKAYRMVECSYLPSERTEIESVSDRVRYSDYERHMNIYFKDGHHDRIDMFCEEREVL